jgi:hypothetical protein
VPEDGLVLDHGATLVEHFDLALRLLQTSDQGLPPKKDLPGRRSSQFRCVVLALRHFVLDQLSIHLTSSGDDRERHL